MFVVCISGQILLLFIFFILTKRTHVKITQFGIGVSIGLGQDRTEKTENRIKVKTGIETETECGRSGPVFGRSGPNRQDMA